jgi:hypothetical protein
VEQKKPEESLAVRLRKSLYKFLASAEMDEELKKNNITLREFEEVGSVVTVRK